jgi:hypothetical protein
MRYKLSATSGMFQSISWVDRISTQSYVRLVAKNRGREVAIDLSTLPSELGAIKIDQTAKTSNCKSKVRCTNVQVTAGDVTVLSDKA